MFVKKLDKNQSKVMQFVKTVASSDKSRPTLETVHFNTEYMVACDGFKLVAVDKPDDLKDLSGNFKTSKVKAGENYLELDEQDCNYPEYNNILPCLDEEKFIPSAKIGINPAFLADIAKFADPNKGIVITAYDKDTPIEVSGFIKQDRHDDPKRFYALIMPMKISNTDVFEPGK